MFITKTLSSFASKITAALMIVMLALAMLPAMPAGAVGTQVTLLGGASWTVPAGVTNISIECWGGGGGGGNRTALNGVGGGGGGGAYAKVLSYAVTPGAVIPISVGAGGGSAVNGGNTTFNTNICVAAGGSAGVTNGAAGAGGLASASTGDIKANGGSGLWNAGGGSAGVTALGLASATAIAGNAPTVCAVGATAVTNGGAGGSGNCTNTSIGGGAGGFPGGGAGGGSKGGGGPATIFGGTGGNGRIIITYLPIITTPTVTGIGTTSATLGANFVNANGGTPTARGVCWGTNPSPTTNCTSSGTATGVYTQSVSGFTAGTSYYYRGYVTDESGTGYSEDGTFTADTTLAVTAPSSVTYPATGTLTASGGSSGGTVSFNYVSGGCSLGGANNATLTITNVSNTPCVVTATRAAGGNYVAQTSANYNVDLDIAPTITSATSTTANGTYGAGGTINITLNFSESISSSAAGLAITLDTGAVINTGALTNVTSWSGTYTVAAGQNSTDLTITSVTGTITDATTNNTVNPTIPVGQNIADSKAIVINTNVPVLNSFTHQTPATSPTNADTLIFRATFSEGVQNVDAGDFTVTDTTATITGVAGVGGGPNYSVYDITVSGGNLAGLNGTVGLDLSAAPTITNLLGNALLPGEPATDETYVVGNNAPTVLSHSLQAFYTSMGLSSFTVTFSEDVKNAGGGAGKDDVTNPANYRVINKGANGILETAACNVPLGGDDSQILPSSVTYVPNIATVTFASSWPAGNYRLFICGTTSIVDLAGNPLNSGTDTTIDFTVASGTGGDPGEKKSTGSGAKWLPSTGFAPNVVTLLPPQTTAYTELSSLWLEIPSLKIKADIVGVPQSQNAWDVKWLGQDAGWLDGTAFPTWEGNSVITGHVTDSNGKPGPFANLKDLKYGEQIIVHLFNGQYVFEVRNKRLVRPETVDFAFEHLKGHSYITLITCQDYDAATDSYLMRRLIRAVLVAVK